MKKYCNEIIKYIKLDILNQYLFDRSFFNIHGYSYIDTILYLDLNYRFKIGFKFPNLSDRILIPNELTLNKLLLDLLFSMDKYKIELGLNLLKNNENIL